MYTQDQFWADRSRGGFRDAVTNALMFLLAAEEPEPEPTGPGNSGEHKPPKKPK